jgi:hypothetical protein
MNFGKDFLCLFGIFVLFDVTYGLHPFKSNSTTLIIADSKVYLETHSKFIDYLTSKIIFRIIFNFFKAFNMKSDLNYFMKIKNMGNMMNMILII